MEAALRDRRFKLRGDHPRLGRGELGSDALERNHASDVGKAAKRTRVRLILSELLHWLLLDIMPRNLAFSVDIHDVGRCR